MPIYPAAMDEIRRFDAEFEIIPGDRPPGGSSLSLGFFKDQRTGKRWLGKASPGYSQAVDDTDWARILPGIAGASYKEMIAASVYAFYGAPIPEMVISQQAMCHTGGKCEGVDVPHVMIAWMEGFQTYGAACQVPFFTVGEAEHHLLLKEGRRLRAKGLGHILAVASLINDIDVMGASGGNIGFVLERDAAGEYAATYKIDPGEAFHSDAAFPLTGRRIRIATQGDAALREVAFDELPESTRQEFLFTLHDIQHTTDAMLMGFFTRRGGHPFILSFGRTVGELTDLLSNRRRQLLAFYAADLARTAEAYHEYCAVERARVSADDWARRTEVSAVSQQLYYYVPPEVMRGDARISLPVVLEAFLEAPATASAAAAGAAAGAETPASAVPAVLLMKGASGSGKSLSLLQLEWTLLARKREHPDSPMPIYIELKGFDRRTIRTGLVKVLKEKYNSDPGDYEGAPVVLLLDGVDEMSGRFEGNLYEALGVGAWHHVKVIVSARSECLEAGYEPYFAPMIDGRLVLKGLEECELAPFSDAQVSAYLEKYVGRGVSGHSVADYQRDIEAIPQLRELLTNPFLLRIVAESLREGDFADLARQMQAGGVINRATLYAAFMRAWFVKQERRLQGTVGAPATADAFNRFLAYAMGFAFALHRQDKTQANTRDEAFRPFLRQDDAQTVYAQRGCPLQRGVDQDYSFIHRSLLEYFTACYLLEKISQKRVEDIRPADIVKEPAVVIFLRQKAVDDPSIKATLLQNVRDSKSDKAQAHAAANAITLLNTIKFNFSQQDFTKIAIPGAILDHALCSGTQFQEADLTGVSFNFALLMDANFSAAILRNVNFGEWPSIQQKGEIVVCAYSKDGALLAVGCNREIYLYNADSQERICVLTGHSDDVLCLAFHPREPILFSGGLDKTARLWNVDSGVEVKCFLGYDSSVLTGVFTPAGDVLVTGSGDMTIRLWNVQDGTEVKMLRGHTGNVTSLAFDPVEHILASGSGDTTVRLWNIADGIEIERLTVQDGKVKAVAFDHTGCMLAAGNEHGIIMLWDRIWDRKGRTCRVFKGHDESITSLAFQPAGQMLASGSRDATVRLWSVRDGRILQRLTGPEVRIQSIAFHPSGHLLMSAGRCKTRLFHPFNLSGSVGSSMLRFWDVASRVGDNSSILHMDAVESVAVDPSSCMLASGGADKVIKLWNMESGELLRTLKGHTAAVTGVAFNATGLILASGSRDWTARVWDVHRGQVLQQLDYKAQSRGGCFEIISIAFSPTRDTLAIGTVLGTLEVWDIKKTQAETFEGSSLQITSLAFDRSGRVLAVGDGWDREMPPSHARDGKVCLTDVSSGKPITSFPASPGGIMGIAFNQAGNILALSTDKGVVQLWDVQRQEKIREFKHADAVMSVAFDPSDSMLASASYDKTIRLTEVISDQASAVINWTGAVLSVQWFRNAKGTFLVMGDKKGAVCLWQVTKEAGGVQARLTWCREYGLSLCRAVITRAYGLTQRSLNLFKQHKAAGEPAEIIADTAMPAAAGLKIH